MIIVRVVRGETFTHATSTESVHPPTSIAFRSTVSSKLTTRELEHGELCNDVERGTTGPSQG